MNKPAPITLSDGRTQAIDHAAYQAWVKTLADEVLFHIIRDARQAEVAMPDGPKAGYYSDEVNYCASEVASRRGARAALDLGKRAGLHRQSQPTVRPASCEAVNRTLVGQAQGGMTASPDGTANRRQVKELQVKKDMFKKGQEVVLVRPDKEDLEWGLGVGVLGRIVKTDGDGLSTVLWAVGEEGIRDRRVMLDSQMEAFKAPRKPRKPADWKYIRGTKKTANYLVATHSNEGVFIKGQDGQDIHIHLGYEGDIGITLWGRRGHVVVRADSRMAVETEKF